MRRIKNFIKQKVPFFYTKFVNIKSDLKGNKNIFNDIYKGNKWLDDESISGPGSKLEATKFILTILPEIFQNYGIKSMLDAPCGDFNWLKNFNFNYIEYTGVDIVKSLIDANKLHYEKENIHFFEGDISVVKLPMADLVLCRDCLVHLSYKTIGLVLENFKKSGAKYLLTTTFSEVSENINIPTGGWRKINLTKAPFHFPIPLYSFNEKCPSSVDENLSFDKNLALWRLEDLGYKFEL